MALQINNLERLCVHTITTKPLSIEVACERYAQAGIKGISVWREAFEGRNVVSVGEMLRGGGLQVVSLVRGGFFPSLSSAERTRKIDDNIKALDEAAALECPMLVLVCGADPRLSLEESRDQIRAGIEAVLPHAEARGVRLAIEPLHPMYADTRSAINTLRQANDMAEHFDSAYVGVAVDVYHLWWDPELKAEIARCGKENNLYAYHICDWVSPTRDMLNDRGLMGEGCIPLRQIRQWVEEAGFNGFHEVEIFSDRYWAGDQDIFIKDIVKAYVQYS
jgi:sugar phosphate isomerase/epimerase